MKVKPSVAAVHLWLLVIFLVTQDLRWAIPGLVYAIFDVLVVSR